MDVTMSEAADQLAALARQQSEANPDLARRLEGLAVIVKTSGTDPTVALFDRLVAASEREAKLIALAEKADAREERVVELLEHISGYLAVNPPPGSSAAVAGPVDLPDVAHPTGEVPRPAPLPAPGRTIVQQLGDLPPMMQVAFGLLCLAVLALVVGLVGVSVTHGDTVVTSGGTSAEKVNESRLESTPDPDIDLDDADGGGDAIDFDTMDTGAPFGPVPQPH